MTDLFDIDDGVLGLEGIWTWAVNGLVLNDQASRPEWIILKEIEGLHSGPDVEVPEDKKFGRIGANPRPASAGGKTVVVQAEIRSLTLPGLRSMSRAVRAAFAPRPFESLMSIAPSAALGGPTGTFMARSSAPPLITDLQTTTSWRRELVLSLRLSEPRVFFEDLAVDESGSSSVSVTNIGWAPADPVVTITGASGDVTLTNGTSTLTWTDVPSGTLIVDFAKRTAKVGTDHAPLVVASSDWWDSFVDGIAPGATVTIAQTGGTGIEVEFTPAVW